MPTADEVRRACETALRTMTVPSKQAEIAFFGGSFTALPREEMIPLLEAAAPFVKCGEFGGIRLSTRPDAIDEELLVWLRSYGVTAIELGAQSMDDEVLSENHRGHTAAQVERAARLIKTAGISLGLQMMTGLPADTDEKAKNTARRLAALQPDTMRIYPTVVIEHTDLARRFREGTYQPQTLEDAITLCAWLLRFFEEEQGIRVIRLGLHAEEEMQSHVLAGPFHPAFRERCESRLWLEQLREMAKQSGKHAFTVLVHPTCVSKAVGQKRENIRALSALGYMVRITADAALAPCEMRLGSD